MIFLCNFIVIVLLPLMMLLPIVVAFWTAALEFLGRWPNAGIGHSISIKRNFVIGFLKKFNKYIKILCDYEISIFTSSTNR